MWLWNNPISIIMLEGHRKQYCWCCHIVVLALEKNFPVTIEFMDEKLVHFGLHVHMCPLYGSSSLITTKSPTQSSFPCLIQNENPWIKVWKSWEFLMVMIPMVLQNHCKYKIVSFEIVVLMPIRLLTIMPFYSKICLHEHVSNHCTNLETIQTISWEGTTITHSSCHCSQTIKSWSITQWTYVGS
jgi:hypothetical protein